MSAVRQDAWSEEDDLILAEVTLRHIREGSTQLTAFEEVGEKIGRTSAACGFRWNSCVRKKYEAAIQIAKAQRQKRSQIKKQNHAVPVLSSVDTLETGELGIRSHGLEETLSIDSVIRFLRQWRSSYQDLSRHARLVEKELQDTRDELAKLREDNEKLGKQVNEVETDYRVVNDDYKALIQIMDRARKLAFLVEEEEDSKARFKMDANGNLERIE
ncbi:RsfA family transcriptional regulator [Paenibacillus aurantius]|uniref:RsfA family transcriptional regulator n=1 Tax=Paenibacillus aurantius TaxID=2918900 RepID=A0AA96RJP4_9BACL|nr:RsfA family transcriptional regulator [Paenibacillus aurantius]WJH33074.1 RsfA family transcriptional regulator [Paenibacillus sp. CC-CFT747]WNQ13499.1 RsfA family transcriptional regulator [Paenibacillus aurantius]